MARGRPSARARLIGLGNKCEVKAWIPSPRMIEIADERTHGMVQYFTEASRGMDFLRFVDAIDRLARSCYLQGMNDTLDATAQLARDGEIKE